MILKKFFFVRHAETPWNEKNICQGQKDIPLSQKGHEKAKFFANHLCELQFDSIVSSPLCRALVSAKEIHDLHPHAEFYTLAELSERSWGELEGISSQEMYEIEKLEENDPSYTPGKKVEKRQEFRKRVEKGIAIAQSNSLHPLIISHGRVFLEICLILGMPLIRQIPNCQLIEIALNGNGWHATLH